MPIPQFDGILNILPPHVGVGGQVRPEDISPYYCSGLELCQKFSTSAARITILRGFFSLRARLLGIGIAGFQWLSGSFVENIEVQERRDPGDIDVITFISRPTDLRQLQVLFNANLDIWDRRRAKATFKVDHFYIPLASQPMKIVGLTKYWYALFSHRRDRIWKGMVTLPMVNSADDAAALEHLRNLP